MNEFLFLLDLGYRYQTKDYGYEKYNTYEYIGEKNRLHIVVKTSYDIRFNYVNLGITKQNKTLLQIYDGVITINRYDFIGLEEYMRNSQRVRELYTAKKRYDGKDLKVKLYRISGEFIHKNIKQLHEMQ